MGTDGEYSPLGRKTAFRVQFEEPINNEQFFRLV
jgi:hypothetical protein